MDPDDDLRRLYVYYRVDRRKLYAEDYCTNSSKCLHILGALPYLQEILLPVHSIQIGRILNKFCNFGLASKFVKGFRTK